MASAYERLSEQDASFLDLEDATTPMHVGSVAVFDPRPGDDVDHDVLLDLVAERIGLVPRFRQRLLTVPGSVGPPLLVDDPDFDLTYHVRRSALPRPGTDEQLFELVGRLMSRRLDRSRPLWEMYLVEGLAGDRTAIISKTHHALVDGVTTVDISTVILDTSCVRTSSGPRASARTDWQPQSGPSPVELARIAATDAVHHPTRLVAAVAHGPSAVLATGAKAVAGVSQLAGTLRRVTRPAPLTPLNTGLGAHRRYTVARTDLADYRAVRSAHGGTVHDVALAVVAGALRSWLLTRGEPLRAASTVRALVPVSVRRPGRPVEGRSSTRVDGLFVDLPVGEPNPVVRLQQVVHAMRTHHVSGRRVAEHSEGGDPVGADTLVALAGFAPATLHALGARTAFGLARGLYNLVVTNVPGPQQPLYAAGARMTQVFPVVPLVRGQAVAIGLTSYDGGMYFGLDADRDAMPDVAVLADCLTDSLAELVATAERETSTATGPTTGRGAAQ